MPKYSRSSAKAWVRDLTDYFLVLTTPFTEKGEVDHAGLKRNVEQSLSLPGVGGLYIGSIYQEFWTLTLDERKRVAETVIETVAGRVPVMAGVTHTSARDALELARHAEASGADLLMIWPPYYGPRTEDGVFAFFEYIATRQDLAICTYSTTLPELGFYITPEFACRLAEIDTVCGLKEASRSLSTYSGMLELAGDRLVVSSPNEEYAFFGMSVFGPSKAARVLLGSSRPLYVQSPEHPYCAEFAKALRNNDMPGAATVLGPIMNAAQRLHNRFVNKGGHNVAIVKYITELLGMAAGPVRPPLSPPSQWEMDEARAVLTELGQLTKQPIGLRSA